MNATDIRNNDVGLITRIEYASIARFRIIRFEAEELDAEQQTLIGQQSM